MFIIRKKEITKNKARKVFRRSFSHYDKIVFQERLNKVDWSLIQRLNNVDEMWDMTLKGIIYETNRLCPYKWISIKNNKQSWYNSSLGSLAKERDKLFQAFIRSKREKPKLYQLALEKRKEHNRAVKKCKEDFFQNCLYLNSENCRMFWNNVNDLTGTKVQPSIDRVFKYDTTYLCSETESIDTINKFFAGVAERLLEELDVGNTDTFCTNLDDGAAHVFEEFGPISVANFLDIIGTFSYTKSSGYEEVNC